MKTSHIQYDPANDTHITTLFLDRDEEGDFLDVDSSLMHSAEHGYYLARKIIQVWDGRSWETATDEEAEASLREHRRSLKTFRPLTPRAGDPPDRGEQCAGGGRSACHGHRRSRCGGNALTPSDCP